MPEITVEGAPVPGLPFAWRIDNGLASSFGVLFFSGFELSVFLPQYGATAYPAPPFFQKLFALDADGAADGVFAVPALPSSLCGLQVIAQAIVLDASALGGFAFTAGLRTRFGGPAAMANVFPGWMALTEGILTWFECEDIDGDGVVDLIGTKTGGNGLLFSKGIGNGELQPAIQTFDAAAKPSDAELGDVDGDGDVDLVALSNFSNRIEVFLQSSGGQLASFADYPTSFGAVPLELADLDADGVLDAAWGYIGSNLLEYRFGNGDGTFGAPITLSALSGSADVLAADLDADGISDLVVANQSSGVQGLRWYRGLGAGSFDAGTNIAQPLGEVSNLLASDFDSDGAVDLALSSYEYPFEVAVLAGDGAGAFAHVDTLPIGSDPGPLRAADLDADGKLDLAVAEYDGSRVVLAFGAGDGTFSAGGAVTIGPAGSQSHLSVSDLDGNGALDLLSGAIDDGVTIALASSPAVFGSWTEYGSIGEATELELADLDGDGRSELLLAVPEEGRLIVYPNPGDGTLGPTTELPGLFGYHFDGPAVGDVTGDGNVDVMLIQPLNELRVSWGDGAGGFGATTVTSIANKGTGGLETGDLDNDGALDVVRTYDSPLGFMGVQTFLGGGNGTFAFAHDRAVAAGPNHLILADMDVDGKLDLVVSCATADQLQVLLGKGDGTTGTKHVLFGGSGVGLAVRDLNLDGVPDVLRGSSFVPVTLHTGVGDGSLSAGQPAIPTDPGGPLELADLNADGLDDLLVLDGVLHLFPGRGDGSFGTPRSFASAGARLVPGVLDLDGDGDADLVTAGQQSALTLLQQAAP